MATPVAFTAVTVRVDESPAVMDVGLAVMLTVGAGFAVTVTVAAAEEVPPGPVAVAVYVVVFDGFTVCVPPAAGRLNELPSEPASVTPEALLAVTVRVDEPPACTDAGIAETVTEGSGDGRKCPCFSPQPATRTAAIRPQIPARNFACDLAKRATGTIRLSSIATPSRSQTCLQSWVISTSVANLRGPVIALSEIADSWLHQVRRTSRAPHLATAWIARCTK